MAPQYTPTVAETFWQREEVKALTDREDAKRIPNGRIETQHVEASEWLKRIAHNFLYYSKSHLDFVRSLQQQLQAGSRELTPAQMRGALNVMLTEYRAKKAHEALQATEARLEAAQPHPLVTAYSLLTELKPQQPQTVTPLILDGTYTIVLDEAGTYRTLQIITCDEATLARYKLPQGAQIARYLSGADNESNYTGFAFVIGAETRVWQRFSADAALAKALAVLMQADKEQRIDYGAAYAMASGRCWRCGRKLTVPASLHRGMGPICAEKI